ncbi:MAG: hypothetical protein HQM11_14905 [SAR324 cluster bacterium]|nr:hypothetical protein [SAR324 cluster bacterium]
MHFKNDSVADGNQNYTISVTPSSSSADTTGYKTLTAQTVSVNNTDNDSPGFTLGTISGNTSEAGGSATFTVKLNSQPNGNVLLNLASSNTSEGTISSSSLTFTTTNWNATQTVTVTGVNDSVADGNQSYTISVTPSSSSADTTGYTTLTAQTVSVSNTDNDSPGFT